MKRVIAVTDWQPNVGGTASDAFYRAYRTRYPAASDDYLVLRMALMIEMLTSAMTRARSADPLTVARTLKGIKFDAEAFHPMTMRAEDHQVI